MYNILVGKPQGRPSHSRKDNNEMALREICKGVGLKQILHYRIQ